MKKLLLIVVFSLIFLGCGTNKRKLEREVALSLNKAFLKNPDYFEYNLRAESVRLLKREKNYYTGLAEVRFDGSSYLISIKVITDRDQFMWKVKAEEFLFIAA